MTAPEPIAVPVLTEPQRAAVRRLASEMPGAADHPPLSDRALLQLGAGAPVRHLVVTDDAAGLVVTDGAAGASLSGYAQLEPDDGTVSVELVADPAAAEPIAAALLQAALESAGAPVRIWAHGEQSPVNQAAQAAGLRVVRRLLQLRMRLAEPERPAAGVVIRPFVPGSDDAAWLAVNARAFADHPEQGGWTQRDLDGRLRAEWFDPAGFLLAERDGRLLGYHWTKVHRDAVDEAGLPLGEVYVLGVDPAAQGMRLGSALLDAGLRHLALRGIRTVLLYVDESNQTAVRLYRKAGFETFAVDVQWGAEAPGTGPTG